MALFGKKKEETKEEVETKKVSESSANVFVDKDLSWVIKRPRITEKTTITASDNKTYVFDVDPRATKTLISKAIIEIYKVTPLKVNVAKIPRKPVFSKGKKGMKSVGKKAYVFLKKEDTIEFV
ncbi:MAG: large subunit ribosomal protein L23 [Candidatus Paceibacteria bacterium]|jgi:large subunit ribosomal protein L23